MGDIPVEAALSIRAEHAEGPAWDAATARLWRADITGLRVHCFDPVSGNDSSRTTCGQPGGVVLGAAGQPVAASPEGLAVLDRDTGAARRRRALPGRCRPGPPCGRGLTICNGPAFGEPGPGRGCAPLPRRRSPHLGRVRRHRPRRPVHHHLLVRPRCSHPRRPAAGWGDLPPPPRGDRAPLIPVRGSSTRAGTLARACSRTAISRERRHFMIERMVLFGASGDLTSRLLMPAVAQLAETGLLPPGFTILGSANTGWSAEDSASTSPPGWTNTRP